MKQSIVKLLRGLNDGFQLRVLRHNRLGSALSYFQHVPISSEIDILNYHPFALFVQVLLRFVDVGLLGQSLCFVFTFCWPQFSSCQPRCSGLAPQETLWATSTQKC